MILIYKNYYSSGGKIPVSAISAALAAHSSHPLNGGMAPPKDQAPSTPGYAPVSAPVSKFIEIILNL